MKNLFGRLLILSVIAALSACASMTKPTEFVNPKPAFSVLKPPGWEEANRKPGDYLAIANGPSTLPALRIAAPAYLTSDAQVNALAQGACQDFKVLFEASKCELKSSKEIKLADGTPAIEGEIEWQHPMIFLYSTVLWVKKGETKLMASMTSMEPVNDSLKNYLYSLKVK